MEQNNREERAKNIIAALNDDKLSAEEKFFETLLNASDYDLNKIKELTKGNVCNSCKNANWFSMDGVLSVYCKVRHIELFNSINGRSKIIYMCNENISASPILKKLSS